MNILSLLPLILLNSVVKDERREEVKPPTLRSSESYRVITLLLDITITYKRS